VNLAELRARHAAILEEARALDTEAGDAAFTPEQTTRFDALMTERGDVEGRIAAEERRIEARTALAALVPQRTRVEDGDGTRSGGPAVHVRRDPYELITERGQLTPAAFGMSARDRTRALIDANLRAVEGRISDADNEAHFERTLRRHARDTLWAANILGRSREEYAEAFALVVTGRSELLDPEQRAALVVGTATTGGYLVPTHLDPTLILTNSGTSNLMRQFASVRTLTTGNVWHGVTTAGVTASWDAETTEVSDDSPATGTAAISVYKPQSLVAASIEAFADIAGLSDDVMVLFADARDRLEGAAHMVGSGSAPEPTGLFTAINASASLKTTSTTAATIGEVDIHALYRALPIRWRRRGSWVMNPLYSTAIKRLGTAVSSSYSGDLTAPVSSRILDHPVVESDDAPTTQTTTALDQEIVFADLSAYTIVDMPGGTSVEFIPHLFNTANNLPDGRRAWYMHWRTGAGMPNLAAGRILVDKTTA
jgi:HK97 family phage major capsid protein